MSMKLALVAVTASIEPETALVEADSQDTDMDTEEEEQVDELASPNDASEWMSLPGKDGGTVYHQSGASGDDQPFFYRTHVFNTDDDGAPRAYSPRGRAGGALDYTANAGHPGNWYGIVTNNNRPSGTPIIQGPNDPAPGFYVSSTSLADGTKKSVDPRRYVDASTVPYVVLPSQLQKTGGAKMGDIATVINLKTGKLSHAIVADSGPSNHIGEGSLALEKAIGASGSVDLLWIVYPGTAQNPHWPVAAATIQSVGATNFGKFGGIAKVNSVFSLNLH